MGCILPLRLHRSDYYLIARAGRLDFSVRLGAFDLAAFFFADLSYGGGSLSTVSTTHALTALWSIIMMNIGLMGILYRAERRFILIELDSLLMMTVYALGLWLLFNG